MTAQVSHWYCDAPCGKPGAYTDGTTTWCELTREECKPETCERAIRDALRVKELERNYEEGGKEG